MKVGFLGLDEVVHMGLAFGAGVLDLCMSDDILAYLSDRKSNRQMTMLDHHIDI